MKKHIICDTGGSKTIIEVLDENFNVIERHTTCGFGLVNDSLEILPELEKVLMQIPDKQEVESVVVNVGGNNKGQIEYNFKRFFPKAQMLIFRESEGVVSQALASLYKAQVVVLAGTGVIAYGICDDDNIVISGGWGMNISDQGSGYEIGLMAIRESLLELDQEKPLSEIAKLVTGLEKPFSAKANAYEFALERDKVRQRFSPITRAGVAKYAKLVVSCAEKGDRKSVKILTNAGKELGKQIIRAVQKTKCKEFKSAVVTGGIVNAKCFIKDSLEREIAKKYKDVTITYLTDGVIEGVRQISKSQNK